jgi:hypothetical protein
LLNATVADELAGSYTVLVPEGLVTDAAGNVSGVVDSAPQAELTSRRSEPAIDPERYELVNELVPQSRPSSPSHFIEFGDSVYFTASINDSPGNRRHLFRRAADGTITKLHGMYGKNIDVAGTITTFGDTLVLLSDNVIQGYVPQFGTVRTLAVLPGATQIAGVGNRLVVRVGGELVSLEMRSNDTPGEAVTLKSEDPKVGGDGVIGLVPAEGNRPLMFAERRLGVDGWETIVWRTDGSVSGTHRVFYLSDPGISGMPDFKISSPSPDRLSPAVGTRGSSTPSATAAAGRGRPTGRSKAPSPSATFSRT